MQDFAFLLGGTRHTFQLTVDILNVANMLSSDWGVRKIASSAATSPLVGVLDANGFVQFDADGKPLLNFNPSLKETYVDDPGLNSRWQMQVGLRYFFQ